MITQAVILAGGFGTRLSEETTAIPKPLVQIGSQPILWHIMKIYHSYGVNKFIICLGYKGYLIKEFFLNYRAHTSDMTIDLSTNNIEIHSARTEPWKITLVDTGASTMTGGRLKRVAQYVGNRPFFMTYGDGVADIDIRALSTFHQRHGKLATVTSVRPPGRFGALEITGEAVTHFLEKPAGDGARINGGFFVLDPKVLSYIEGDTTTWEKEPLMKLAQEGELHAYVHDGFWQPMDTLRDKRELNTVWESGKAPWKVW